jgi:hypothetical protein
MKKRTLFKGMLKWPVMTFICLTALGTSIAQAQTNGCVYLTSTVSTGTQLYKLHNPGTSGVTAEAVGTPNAVDYSSIAYYNGYIYAIAANGLSGGNQNVYRIDPNTGVILNTVGTFATVSAGNLASCEIINGVLYTSNMNGGSSNWYFYSMNLTTGAVTSTYMGVQFADFVNYNGYLYGLGRKNGVLGVYRIDPATAATTTVGTNPGASSQSWASWGDGTGMIYFENIGTFNVNTGVSTANTAIGAGGVAGPAITTNTGDGTICLTCNCATAPATTTVSGNVYSDPAGNNTGTTGTNAGGTLYASLVNSAGTVVATVPVAANGSYSFPNVTAGTYSVALTTNPSGSATPSLPTGYVPTGEGYQVWDPVKDGKINNITVGSTPVTPVNFMIERLPTAGTSNPTMADPGGTNTLDITNQFTGTDPDGTVAQIHFTTFPTNTTSIKIGNTTYTSANWPAAGVTVPVGTPVLLDPTGTGNPVVPYKVIDNAGMESTNPGSVTVNLTAPAVTTVSGNVYSDPAGNNTGTTGTNAGGTLYASLINSAGTVVATVPVAANGSYSFPNVTAGTYSVALTTNPSGSATPSLPTGYVPTGEGYQVWDPVEDGKINNITVGTTPVSPVNFLIERLPTAGTSNPTMTNPGGTNTLDITNQFTGTDPDGTVTQIHFTTFPTNTTSIKIGNTTYTPANWPAAGVTVPVGTPVLLDPIDGTAAPVVPYKVIDNAGMESTNPGSVTVNLTAPAVTTVSGNVYSDPAGNNTGTTGTNAGGALYASLVNSAGTVVATVPVAANGSYSFPNVTAGTYSVALTTNPSGSAIPSLPTGYVPTGEGYQVWDPVKDGKINNITVGTSPVTPVNFLVEQLPTAGTSNVTMADPGGTGTLNLTPNFTGTDPDGTIAQIHFTTFPTNTTSITIGGTTYTPANWPAAGVTVPTGTPVSLDPTGTGNPVVPYKVIDNGGMESTNPGSVTVNLTAPAAYTVSGNIYDDANGGTIDGTGTNASGTLYVVLANASGTIIGSSPVAANGTYSISAPAGTYSAILTTSPTSITPALPTGWANTNEGLTTAGEGTTADGKILTVSVTGNVGAANFGIDQLPTAGISNPTMTDPGGTGTLNLTPNFTGTDPDGTIAQIHFTTFPTNTTSITIGGTTYTPANWPAAGVTIPAGTTVSLDPTGTGNPVVPYKVIDNAGKESTNPGSVTVNLTTAGTTTTVSGNVYSDPAGNHVGVTGTNAGGTLYASLVNASGTVVATVPVAADGSYSFPNVTAGTYAVVLTTNPSGSSTPSLPAGYVPTGEEYDAWDPVKDGKINNITVGSTPVGPVSFLIERLPTAGTSSLSAADPGGTGTLNLTSYFTGTDPDGTVAQLHFTTFPTNTTSITIGGTTYTPANWPAAGVTVPTGTTVSLDPTGTGNPVVPYKVIDNAGMESASPGSVTVNLTAAPGGSISGIVHHDADGGTVDGPGTNMGSPLYVLMYNPATNALVGSGLVAADGSYTIPGLAIGTYNPVLSSSPTGPAPIPAGWAMTGILSTPTGLDFGVEQLPTAGTASLTMPNPGGTGTLNLTPNFTGTDPDGTIAQIHFTTFPTNTTSITIGGTPYTAANWPAAGVTVPTGTTVLLDPVDGTAAPVVPYKVIDNAGKESTNTGSTTVNLTAPGAIPDLTPSVDIDNLSFPVAGVPRDFVVNVFEMNGGIAGNPITVRIAKLSAFTITYAATSGTSNVYGGVANENSNWDFTENASFIIATAKPGVTIPANGAATLGFTISRKTGIINGTTQNLTTTIVGGSGGETNTTNNKTLTSFTASGN